MMNNIEELEAALEQGKNIKARADRDGFMIQGQPWMQVIGVGRNEVGDKVMVLADGTQWYFERAYIRVGRK